MEISKQERAELIEMTVAISQFLTEAEFTAIIMIYHRLTKRMMEEENGNAGREDQKNS